MSITAKRDPNELTTMERVVLDMTRRGYGSVDVADELNRQKLTTHGDKAATPTSVAGMRHRMVTVGYLTPAEAAAVKFRRKPARDYAKAKAAGDKRGRALEVYVGTAAAALITMASAAFCVLAAAHLVVLLGWAG